MQEKKNLKKIIIIVSICLIVIMIFVGYFLGRKTLKITLDASDKIKVNVNSNFKEAKVNACYGNIFKCKKVDYTKSGIVDTSKEGTYKLKYNASYKNKSKSVSQIIEVADLKSPDLEIAEEEFSVCPNGKLKKYETKAFDNKDGDLTNNIKIEVKGNKLVFKVSDLAKNTTTKSFAFKKEDKDGPVITLNGNSEEYIQVNGFYEEQGYKAIDDCDGDISDKVEVSGSVDNTRAGEYMVIYKAKDSQGNISEVKRKVMVLQDLITIDPPKKTIYLTFDDGPGPYTEKLLDVLAKYNVKATFFVTNQYPAYQDLIAREYKEGHAIGIHTYTHNYAAIYPSVDAYFNDLNTMSDIIKKQTGGYETKLVRFPGGSSNTVSKKYSPGIMSTLSLELKMRGYKYFDWNVSSGDAGGTRDTNQVVNNVITNLRDSYSNVLQHDVKSFSVDAVEEIIKYGLNNGYSFAPLDITSPGSHQRINN